MSYSLNSVIINQAQNRTQKMQLYFAMDMVVMVMIYQFLQIIGKTFADTLFVCQCARNL